MSSPNSYVKVLTPVPQDVSLFGESLKRQLSKNEVTREGTDVPGILANGEIWSQRHVRKEGGVKGRGMQWPSAG